VKLQKCAIAKPVLKNSASIRSPLEPKEVNVEVIVIPISLQTCSWVNFALRQDESFLEFGCMGVECADLGPPGPEIHPFGTQCPATPVFTRNGACVFGGSRPTRF